MGFQWVPVENSLNADVAPVADPFFQPLLAVVGRCWSNGHCWKCNGFINLLNLRLNLLNCNGFATGFPLQPVGHLLHQQLAPFLMTNAVERSLLALGTRDGHGIPKCSPCPSVVFLMLPVLSVRFRGFFRVASTYVRHTDR